MSLPRQLISPYHLLHYTVLALYFAYLYPNILRPRALETPIGEKRLLEMGYTSLNHEQELIGMVVMAYVLKLKRMRNFDEAWHRLLTHGKVLTVLMTYLTMEYWIMGGILALYGVMLVLLVPPKYKGESRVTPLNPYTFSSQVRDKYDKNVSHVVIFNTTWASDCHFFEPVFADLSVRFTSATQLFESLNLDQYPELAEEFRIDVGTGSKQLPTIVLFYRGREVRRLPPFDDNGKVVRTTMDKKGVIKYFELDKDPGEASYRMITSKQSSKKSQKKTN